MSQSKFRVIILLLVTMQVLISCNQNKSAVESDTVISDTLKWSVRLAESIMKRYPEAWQVDSATQPSWNYKHGLLALSVQKLYQETGDEAYLSYLRTYSDALIDSTGTIYTYDMEEYNIDQVNAGKILFDLYTETGDERYIKALHAVRKQFEGHPRTKSGGFWHKQIYPYQMWLDGLYMGQPLYTRYTVEFENGEKLDDVALQFELSYTHTYDEETGLLLHAWDESKQMPWADKETGKSPNFWSRSLGWYCMALVDVLDYFPADHPKHAMLVSYLQDLSAALVKVQDETGLWYQVPNLPDREGNYLEASGSAMFAYAFAKAAKKGYLTEDYLHVANKTFDGLIDNLVVVDEDGEVHITQICKGAGLGGNPYRDGSFEYYMSEARKVNNLHGLGPFIMAALELDR